MGLLLTFRPQFLNWENKKSGRPTFCSYPSSSLEKYKIPYLGVSMRVSQMRLNAGLIEDVKLVTLICRFMKLGPDSETPSWVILVSPHGFDSISAATFLLMSLQSTLVAKIPALLPSKPNPIPRVV